MQTEGKDSEYCIMLISAPRELKNLFKLYCMKGGKTMTEVLVSFMRAKVENVEGDELHKNASEKQNKCGNEENINGNSRAGLRTCENCERIIGNLELPYIYNNKIVCKECSNLLHNEKDDA
jgi:hypothetical protein